mmetsp:Transcript_22125/g.69893  ORF Transcript_22125/g.69893 Transcript_22125/m.69893 type:complete len:255 (-) Transcript_22125:348-1112(-)
MRRCINCSLAGPDDMLPTSAFRADSNLWRASKTSWPPDTASADATLPLLAASSCTALSLATSLRSTRVLRRPSSTLFCASKNLTMEAHSLASPPIACGSLSLSPVSRREAMSCFRSAVTHSMTCWSPRLLRSNRAASSREIPSPWKPQLLSVGSGSTLKRRPSRVRLVAICAPRWQEYPDVELVARGTRRSVMREASDSEELCWLDAVGVRSGPCRVLASWPLWMLATAPAESAEGPPAMSGAGRESRYARTST